MAANFRRIALVRAARLLDLAIVSLTFIAAFAVTSSSLTWPSFSEVLILRIKVINVLLFGAYLVLCSAIFSMCGFYASHRLSRWQRHIVEIAVAVTLITASILVLRWPLNLEFATAGFLLWYWLLTFGSFELMRAAGRELMRVFRAHGKNLRSVVIVGESEQLAAWRAHIETQPSLGYRIIGVIDVKGGQK